MKKTKLLGLICSLLVAPSIASCSQNSEPSTSQPSTPETGVNEFVDVEQKDQEILNKMFNNQKISLNKEFVPSGTAVRAFKVGKEAGKETNCFVMSESVMIVGNNVNLTLYVHVVDKKVAAISHDGALTTSSFASNLPKLEEALQKYVGTDGGQIQSVAGVTESSKAIHKLVQEAIIADAGGLQNNYSLEIRHAPTDLTVGDKIELNILYDINNIRQEKLPDLIITTSDKESIKVVQQDNKVTVEALKAVDSVKLTLTHPDDNKVSAETTFRVVESTEEKQNFTLTATTGTEINADLYKGKYTEIGFLLMNYDIEGPNKVDLTTELEFNILEKTIATGEFTTNRLLKINLLKAGSTKIEVWVKGLEYTKITITLTVTDSTPAKGNYSISSVGNVKTEFTLYYESVPKEKQIIFIVRDLVKDEVDNNIPLVVENGDEALVSATISNNRTLTIKPTKTKTGKTTVKVSLKNFPDVSITYTVTVLESKQ